MRNRLTTPRYLSTWWAAMEELELIITDCREKGRDVISIHQHNNHYIPTEEDMGCGMVYRGREAITTEQSYAIRMESFRHP